MTFLINSPNIRNPFALEYSVAKISTVTQRFSSFPFTIRVFTLKSFTLSIRAFYLFTEYSYFNKMPTTVSGDKHSKRDCLSLYLLFYLLIVRKLLVIPWIPPASYWPQLNHIVMFKSIYTKGNGSPWFD